MAPMPRARAIPAADRLTSSPLGDDLSFLLARANAMSVAEVNAALAEHGLKVRAFAVLAIVADDVRPSQRELADFLRLDPSQIVVLVDDLERRGLVERLPDPDDRRAKVVVATPAGERLAADARAAARAADDRTYAALTPAAREHLTGLLRRIAIDDVG